MKKRCEKYAEYAVTAINLDTGKIFVDCFVAPSVQEAKYGLINGEYDYRCERANVQK